MILISIRWLLAIFCICSLRTTAHSINLINVSMDNLYGAVHIFYHLNSPKKKKRYKTEVQCSQDGGLTFTDPLIGVSGDVGYNVKAGANKMINWANFVDLPNFNGRNVAFKTTGRKVLFGAGLALCTTDVGQVTLKE